MEISCQRAADTSSRKSIGHGLGVGTDNDLPARRRRSGSRRAQARAIPSPSLCPDLSLPPASGSSARSHRRDWRCRPSWRASGRCRLRGAGRFSSARISFATRSAIGPSTICNALSEGRIRPLAPNAFSAALVHFGLVGDNQPQPRGAGVDEIKLAAPPRAATKPSSRRPDDGLRLGRVLQVLRAPVSSDRTIGW